MNLPMLNQQPAEKRVERKDGALEIVGIFSTIQGEGPYVGTPAVFIRTAGCVLQCPLCFGTKQKSRIPYLSRSFGPKVRLTEVKVGEKILTFDQDFQMVETEVTEILKREVNEWLTITIANKVYDVTPEHPFFTNRGLVPANELMVGDEILEARPNEIIAYKKLGERNPMKDPEVAAKSSANTDWEAAGKKLSEVRKTGFANGTITPPFYMLSPEQQQEWRKRSSEAKRREKNPNWKGKTPNFLDVQEMIDKKEITTCERCTEESDRLLIHHADGNHDNDARSNLKVWCHKCHNQHHERGYNFWNGKRADGKKLVNEHNGQTVEFILRRKGRMPVINISCAPYNTYLANGMWVHNCDTDYTSGRELLNIEVIADRVDVEAGWEFDECDDDEFRVPTKKYTKPIELVVITGGEPLRQSCGPLVRLLFSRGYTIQIETNGMVDDITLTEETAISNFMVVCSPKGPIHKNLRNNIDALKYVVKHGMIDPMDGLPTSALDLGLKPGRPWEGYEGEIFVQPADEQNEEKNALNMEAAVKSCMDFGYQLCIQVHKICRLP